MGEKSYPGQNQIQIGVGLTVGGIMIGSNVLTDNLKPIEANGNRAVELIHQLTAGLPMPQIALSIAMICTIIGMILLYVAKMKGKRDINGLIKALEYKRKNVDRELLLTVQDPWDKDEINFNSAGEIRKMVLLAFEEIGDKRAVEPLIIALREEPYDDCRSYAARALGKMGDARAIEPLEYALYMTKIIT
jgi:hypothetical protein